MSSAAGTLKQVPQELGGKSPVRGLDAADLANAVALAFPAGFNSMRIAREAILSR
ncbi:hypothetical protein JCM19000A_35320 [Silvimonas sp. JCM 19000]